MLDTATHELLSACWTSGSRAVGGACGTVGSLARALARDEGAAAEGVAALIGLGYLGRDRYGVVWVTAAGADIVSSEDPAVPRIRFSHHTSSSTARGAR